MIHGLRRWIGVFSGSRRKKEKDDNDSVGSNERRMKRQPPQQQKKHGSGKDRSDGVLISARCCVVLVGVVLVLIIGWGLILMMGTVLHHRNHHRGNRNSHSGRSHHAKADSDTLVMPPTQSAMKPTTTLRRASTQSLIDDQETQPPTTPATANATIQSQVRLSKSDDKMLRMLPSRWDAKTRKLLRIIVIGDDWVIKRDLPLIRRAFDSTKMGFEIAEAISVYPSSRREIASHVVTIQSIRKDDDWDVVLCLAVSSCLELRDFDARFATSARSRQRINRIPGLREILWNKNEFCHTVMASGDNTDAFSFPCWVLGDDDYLKSEQEAKDLLRVASMEINSKKSWIVKPWASGGGRGIRIVDGVSGIKGVLSKPKTKVIVQPYLGNPLLINGRKIDLRCYVLVTSMYPLRAYIHSRGLVRFASSEYQAEAPRGGNRNAFLTNTSVNGNVTSLTWTFRQLCEWFGQPRCDTVFASIDQVITKVLRTAQPRFSEFVNRNIYQNGNTRAGQYLNCYHLLGVDVIIDDMYRPRVIEVNGEPSMKSSGDVESDYDRTKMKMMHDVAAILFSPTKSGSSMAPGSAGAGDAPDLDEADQLRFKLMKMQENDIQLPHEFRNLV